METPETPVKHTQSFVAAEDLNDGDWRGRFAAPARYKRGNQSLSATRQPACQRQPQSYLQRDNTAAKRKGKTAS